MDEMIAAVHEVLRSLRLKYVIIGGIAASLWGRPRMTSDIDLVTVVEKESVSRLITAFRQRGFKITINSMPKIIARVQRGLPVKLRYRKPFSIDLRAASYEIDRRAIERAKRRTLFGVRIPIASPEDVIIYKVARFEDLDKADLKAIILRKGSQLDIPYLSTAGRTLANETGNKEILHNLSTVLTWIKKNNAVV